MNETFFRILAAVILFSAIGVSVYHRRKADRESGGRVSTRDEGKLMVLALRLGGLLLWLSAIAYLINPAWMAWSKAGLPLPLRWLGVGMGLICDLLVFWLFRSLGNSISPTVSTRQDHRLVTSGPYRYIRHPLYTFGTLLFLSFGMAADNWLFAVLAIFAFILLALRTPNEEAHLIAAFGDEYRDYMRTTGAFLPRLQRAPRSRHEIME